MNLNSPADFLRRHHARRMSEYQAPPFMSADVIPIMSDDSSDDAHELAPHAERKAPDVTLDYESELAHWKTRRVSDCGSWPELDNWALRPRRFVDGKDVGRTVAWLQSEDGFPIPLRLSIVGAIALNNCNGRLQRQWHSVQRVLTMVTDAFPLDETAAFADALSGGRDNIRLHSVSSPKDGLSFDWERTSGRTRSESRKQMNELEKQAMRFETDVPTLVDGPLTTHTGGFDPQLSPVVGLVKSHHVEYFAGDNRCWNTLYSLEPGERTPGFLIKSKAASYDVVSWYLRLCGGDGEMPNWGIVRVEVAQPFFDAHCNWSDADKWSRLICQYRCTDQTYGRAPVSIHPIVRAEQSLSETFSPLDSLVHRFYRTSGL